MLKLVTIERTLDHSTGEKILMNKIVIQDSEKDYKMFPFGSFENLRLALGRLPTYKSDLHITCSDSDGVGESAIFYSSIDDPLKEAELLIESLMKDNPEFSKKLKYHYNNGERYTEEMLMRWCKVDIQKLFLR